MTTLCADCGRPLDPGALVVPVTRIGADGDPMMGELNFAHRLCLDAHVALRRLSDSQDAANAIADKLLSLPGIAIVDTTVGPLDEYRGQ